MLRAQTTDTTQVKRVDSAALKHIDSMAVRHSTVKTLTDEQYNHILNGDDIYNLSYVAQLYRYPNPDDILKYRTRLKLSAEQVKKLKEIKATLHMKKVEVGLSVVQNERMIDSMFRTRRLSEGLIVYYTNRYGLYQGEYRGALLIACYNTRKVLNPVQLNQYNELLNHN
jgi:predicted transcriptional regulator